jgi:RNA polymerase sigma-70 factor (ECF subfamily)
MLVDFAEIERARSGDDAAFGRVVAAYRKRVLGTIARLINQPDDVEDVGQEVFVRVYYSLGRLRTPEVFEPWLYRMTVNAAYDYLRKRKRRPERRMSDLSDQQMSQADAAMGMVQDGEQRQRTGIREKLDELLVGVSEEDRILLVLKEVEGLSLKELEGVYHVSVNALKVRLFRARQRVLKAFAAMKGRQEVGDESGTGAGRAVSSVPPVV